MCVVHIRSICESELGVEHDSIVDIVIPNGLDSRDCFLVGVRFSTPAQTIPGIHPASLAVGTGLSFPGG
jgi:hypothetical protein